MLGSGSIASEGVLRPPTSENCLWIGLALLACSPVIRTWHKRGNVRPGATIRCRGSLSTFQLSPCPDVQFGPLRRRYAFIPVLIRSHLDFPLSDHWPQSPITLQSCSDSAAHVFPSDPPRLKFWHTSWGCWLHGIWCKPKNHARLKLCFSTSVVG